jgi:hypothetical protein
MLPVRNGFGKRGEAQLKRENYTPLGLLRRNTYV